MGGYWLFFLKMKLNELIIFLVPLNEKNMFDLEVIIYEIKQYIFSAAP